MWRKDKVGWEQTRAVVKSTGFSKGDMTFPWENDTEDEVQENKADVLREMKEMEKILNRK